MRSPRDLGALGSAWKGTYRLWVDLTEPVRESETTATLSSVAAGNFTRFDYTWEADGRPQDGSMLIGFDAQREVVTAVWVDSWHMSVKAMVCEGRRGDGGSVEFPQLRRAARTRLGLADGARANGRRGAADDDVQRPARRRGSPRRRSRLSPNGLVARRGTLPLAPDPLALQLRDRSA